MALADLRLSWNDFYQCTPAEVLNLHMHWRRRQEEKMEIVLHQTRLLMMQITNMAGKYSRMPMKPEDFFKLPSEMRRRPVDVKVPTFQEVMKAAEKLKGKKKP